MELEFDNHDDIFQIISWMQGRQFFTEPGQNTEFKLFSEVMLKNREHPLFAEFRPALSDFMKRLKNTPLSSRRPCGRTKGYC